MTMVSVIITAWKEPLQAKKAIDALLSQGLAELEIILVAPDQETLAAAKEFSRFQVRTLKDKGEGKPAALNEALRQTRGNIIVFTDGDVYVAPEALKNLLYLLQEEDVAAVTARPVSLESKNNKLGFWSHLLTDAGAHERRLFQQQQKGLIAVSGYLYAIRASVLRKTSFEWPEGVLSDDAFISHWLWGEGYRIGYEPAAQVMVHYPKTMTDWMLQKKRSAGGYNQLKRYYTQGFLHRRLKNGMHTIQRPMRSFWQEVWFGWWRALTYPKTATQLWWTAQLFLVRLYLWITIFVAINILKQDAKTLWKRVESSK